MREINFRVWDKKSQKMYPVKNIYDVGGKGIRARTVEIIGRATMDSTSYATPTSILVGSRTILMQYTGLKDKNDVDIYEGDVVRILYTDWPSKSEADPRTLEMYLRDLAHVGKIVFNPYYGWRVEDVGGINHGEHGYIEVIGNIYENPELLENE